MNRIFRLVGLCAALFSPSSRLLALAPASDTLAPVLSCPASITLTLDAGRCDTFFQYSVTLTDDQPGATMTQLSGTPPAGAALAAGKTVNLFHAADAAGNTSTCVFSVRVKHPAVPLACRDTLRVLLDASCSFSVYYLDLLTGSGYGCPKNFTIDFDTLAPFADGTWSPPAATFGGRKFLLGYRVRDAATATACTGYLRLLDTTPPTATCTDILTSVLLSAYPNVLAGREIPGAFPTVQDDCGPIKAANMIYADTLLAQGGWCLKTHSKTLRTWTVSDQAGNTASCTQTITLLNHQLSEVQFPSDDTLACLAYGNIPHYPYIEYNQFNYSMGGWNATQLHVAREDKVLSRSCEGANILLRRIWTVEDGCTSTSLRDTIHIHYQDKSGPTLRCVPAVLLDAQSSNGCTGAVDLPDWVIDDDCSRVASTTAFWTNALGQKDSLPGTLTSFPLYNKWARDTLGRFGVAADFPLGQTLVTFVATDPCGNTGTCVSRVSVPDNAPPTARCDTLLTVFLDKNGQAKLNAAHLNTSSSDHCTAPQNLECRARRSDGKSPQCSPSPLFDTFAYFCCADIGDTVPVTLRVFDIQLPTDTIPADRFAGQHSDCTARVLVRDSLPPICSPMPNINMNCATWRQEIAKLDPRQATSCSTDSVSVSIDTTQLSLCGKGKIVRSISAFNAQGQHTSTCQQTINIGNGFRFFVKFPDDTDTYGRCPKDINSRPQLFEQPCGPIDISYTDSLLAPGNNSDCFGTIRRRWRVKDVCFPSDNVSIVPNPDGMAGPTVSYRNVPAPWTATTALINGHSKDFWWYYGSSGYQYDQYITLKVMPMSVAPQMGSTALLGAMPYIPDSTLNDGLLWNHPLFGNPSLQGDDLNEAPADLRFSIRDSCGLRRLRLSYQLLLDLDGDGARETKVSVADGNNPSPGGVYFGNNKPGNLPIWALFDQRPVPEQDKYRFDLDIDTIGDLFTARAVWAYGWANASKYAPLQLPQGRHEIIWQTSDNCYGWPSPTKSLVFTVGPANPAQHKVAGHVRTELNIGVEDVKTSLQSPTLSLPEINLSDDNGAYQFAAPLFEPLHYAIVPEKDQNPLNGVSTYDLTLISKHVLGLEAITSPYRIIAADANRSASVTTFDIVELRKLILGIYPKLPNAPSWRFVPKSHVFPQPDNPFVKGFPEKIERPSLPADRPDEDFVGIKVGDLNGSVVPNAQSQPEDRSGSAPVHLEADDRPVQAGEEFAVQFSVKKPVAGYQFTLETPGLRVTGAAPGAAMSPDHFSVQPSAIAVSFESARGRESSFQVSFKAEKSGVLSQMLHLSDRVARSEAYPLSQPLPPAEMSLQIRPAPGAAAAPPRGFELFPNQPNPFADETLLPFYLPSEGQAALSVYDPSGRRLLLRSAHFPQGYRSFLLKKSDLGAASGVLFYRIETESGAAAGKMAVD
jgi:hypothetical protein